MKTDHDTLFSKKVSNRCYKLEKDWYEKYKLIIAFINL